jgi:hypothetical protein
MLKVERAIQKALVHWLKTDLPQIKVAASQNEDSFHNTDLGMDVGEPDLRLLFRSEGVTHLYYVELKKKKGKLHASQIKWNADFDKNYASSNCMRDVAYGYVDAQIKIRTWYESLA